MATNISCIWILYFHKKLSVTHKPTYGRRFSPYRIKGYREAPSVAFGMRLEPCAFQSKYSPTHIPTLLQYNRDFLLFPASIMPQYTPEQPRECSYTASPTNVPFPLTTSAPTIAARRLGTPPTEIIKPESLQYDHKIYIQNLTPPVDIVSPTVVAARDYYLNLNYQLDTPPYSGTEADALQMRIHPAVRNIAQASTIPRRHSAALEPYPRPRMVDIKADDIQLPRRGSASPPRNFSENEYQDVKNDVDREWWKQKVKDEDFDDSGVSFGSKAQKAACMQNIVQDAAVPEQQIHNPLDPRLLGNIPFSYTANKLREWGDVYLFNSSTADAFVRAIAIPPAQSSRARHAHVSPNDLHRALSDFSISTKSIKQEDDEEQEEDEPNTAKQLVKVRIIPQSRSSRPFYMQKYFPIRKSSSCRIRKHVASPRHHIRHQEEHYQGTKVEILQNVVKLKTQRRPAVPIR